MIKILRQIWSFFPIPVRVNFLKIFSCRGSFYIETLISVTMVGIIATSILPLYPRLLQTTSELKIHFKLADLGEYVGDYVFRWASFDPQSKQLPFEFYSEGAELELSGEKRINRLLWADNLTTGVDPLPDQYKTSIKFYETARFNSAVIKIVVWYDSNLDDVQDSNEKSFSFSTVVTEKRL